MITALRAADSQYAPLLDALVATLPEPDGALRASVSSLARGRPPSWWA